MMSSSNADADKSSGKTSKRGPRRKDTKERKKRAKEKQQPAARNGSEIVSEEQLVFGYEDDCSSDDEIPKTEEEREAWEKEGLRRCEMEINENSKDGFDEEDDREVCICCGENPCDWDSFGEQIIQGALACFPYIEGEPNVPEDESDVIVTKKNIVRKHCYHCYVYSCYGHLGKGNRVHVPSCVAEKIRERFPEDDDNNYMGHKDK